MSRALRLKAKEWSPDNNQSSSNPYDVENYEMDDEEYENLVSLHDDILKDDEDDKEDESEDDLDPQTEERYFVACIEKKKTIDDFINENSDSEEELKNSKKIDKSVFNRGKRDGDSISLETHNLIKEDV